MLDKESVNENEIRLITVELTTVLAEIFNEGLHKNLSSSELIAEVWLAWSSKVSSILTKHVGIKLNPKQKQDLFKVLYCVIGSATALIESDAYQLELLREESNNDDSDEDLGSANISDIF